MTSASSKEVSPRITVTVGVFTCRHCRVIVVVIVLATSYSCLAVRLLTVYVVDAHYSIVMIFTSYSVYMQPDTIVAVTFSSKRL